MGLPAGVDRGGEAVSLDGPHPKILRHRDAVDVETEGIAGLGDDGRDCALERVEPAVFAGHRIETIEAQGRHEVALAQNHDLVICQREIRQVLREIALSRELAAACLEQSSSVSEKGACITRQSCRLRARPGSSSGAPSRRRRAAPRRNVARGRRRTRGSDRQ